MIKRTKIRNSVTYTYLHEYKSSVSILSQLNKYSAHAIGIGRKVVKGKPGNQLCLRVYVEKKLSESKLDDSARIPGNIRFFSGKKNKEVTISTDVIEAPRAQLEPFDPEARHRPVMGGLSGGISGDTGTIGGWVWDETDDTIVMLSNDHVFGHTVGSDILQPGTADGGTLPADKIGDTKRGIARTDPPNINNVDCAIGDPDSDDIYELTVHDIGPAVYAIDVATLDMEVEKYGQTTEHTYGIIEDVNWSGMVSGRLYDDCIFVEHAAPSADWSAGGDSGSLVFSQTSISSDSDIKPVVGLHFAGGGTHGIECKIQNVFNDLNLTTLCAGAFSSFLDSLFGAEEEGEVSTESEEKLIALSSLASRKARSFAPSMFIRKEKLKRSSQLFHAGISRDIQAQLRLSKKGKEVTDYVDKNRHQLLTLLTKDGDVRRATVTALRPMVEGAITTYDVLERKLTEQDVERINRLMKIVSRKSDKVFNLRMKMFRSMVNKAEGRSIAQLLDLKL
ncbi:MAG: hypothetical protein QNL62_07200 [Gammaproteobacteria bacterium]|nr:hypothetical protein [Gammaproteobacteria bacterium]